MATTKLPRRSRKLAPVPDKVVITPQRLHWRLMAIVVFICLCALGLIVRLFFLQVIQADELTARARQQQVRVIQTFRPRRTITDRNGMVLAVDQAVYTVYAHPHLLKEPPQEVAEKIAPILRRPVEELHRLLSLPTTSVRLVRWLNEEASDALRRLRIEGIDFIPQQKRIYPHKNLAAEIIGYVDVDHVGQAGLEKSQEELLKRPEYTVKVVQDGMGRLIPNETPRSITENDQASMQLTIDGRLQRTSRELLQAQISKFSAKRGAAVVMDAHTGEILTLVTQPTYDPNRFFDYYRTPEVFRNWAVSDLFEPGSTFKPINVAIALDQGVIRPNTVIYDQGTMLIGGAVIGNFDGGITSGYLTITEILAQSSNIGMIHMIEAMPRRTYYEWLKRIGINQKMGTDLPAEAVGQLKPPEEFLNFRIEPAAASFGQGFSLTVLKMVQLTAMLANGGLKVTPHVVRGIVDGDGKLKSVTELPEPQRIFTQTTANQVANMMTSVVENGTGRSARIPGYRYGGKTGTAQKAGPDGGYTDGKITSFVGIFPAESPRYVAIAVVDEPTGEQAMGSTVAAPVVKGILEELITIKGIPPTHPEELNRTETTRETTLEN